jgi:hypothetical protein
MWLTGRPAERHRLTQRDVVIGRVDPVLQFLEAQAVADFPVRPGNPQLDPLSCQFSCTAMSAIAARMASGKLWKKLVKNTSTRAMTADAKAKGSWT